MNKKKSSKSTDDKRLDVHRGLTSASVDLNSLWQAVNGMEQGMIVWNADGICVLFSDRIFDVLEIRVSDLSIGTNRIDFLAIAQKRGELDQAAVRHALERFTRNTPFRFDRALPSGRTISTAARPLVDGSYVMTFTDVTETRSASSDLDEARKAAELAQAEAILTLENETARQRDAAMLAELGEWLQSCKSLDELYNVLTEYMRQMMPNSRGELYVYSNSRDVLDGAVSWNTAEIQDHIKPDSCWALRRGRKYSFLPEKIRFECPHVQGKKTHSLDDYICVPIVAHGDTVGLLHVQFLARESEQQVPRFPHKFTAQCAELISLAIANVKLRDELQEQSTRDPLTGLFNRRYFLEAMRAALHLQGRKQGAFGVISFDADKFKWFNDNHGHDAGDMVLRELAEMMCRSFSVDEVLCRYGGEEFMILLPEATREETIQAAERLREKVQHLSVSYGGRKLPAVTISCGVASFPDDGTQVQDILKNADDALYLAKKNGRNQVVDTSRLNVANFKAI
jgi:diguanylate cyclase (GGDEF)-like protein